MCGVPASAPSAVGPSRLRWALATALWPWVVARALVGGSLAIAHELVNGAHLSAAAAARVREGLLGWDAGWYESIARHGYAGAGHSSLRFFPLFPVLAKAVSVLPGIGAGTAVVVVANLSALGGTAIVAALARHESGDEALARRAAWLVCLAPPAFTMVMGYAEGTLLLLSAGALWALRTRRWWLAAALGVGAGLCRPIGVLLVVPAAIEGLREWRGEAPAARAARVSAIAGPAVGFGAYLGWVAWRYGGALAPLRIQEEGVHRGPVSEPFRTLAHDASLLVHGHHLGSALHLPWVVLAVALVVVAFRRWPACYGAFGAAVVAVALTTANLDGFERYAVSGFPLVLAGASLTASARVERTVLVLAGAGLVGYSLLAFTNLYVP
ncbi:MAG TPA: mannosyltransferase family protein [Acidimicrobiales bacterium]|nr:mannosyltransferase family protein [Acidimicrobiales bacterium]